MGSEIIFERVAGAFREAQFQAARLLWAAPFAKLLRATSVGARMSIGVTTFKDRFTKYFRPLLEDLCFLFPRTPVIVCANGHVDVAEHEKYLIEIAEFCKRFPQVTLVPYHEPRGLAEIWNEICRRSVPNKVLILNDDLVLTPFFGRWFERAGVWDERIVLINGVFSHYLVDTSLVQELGGFDEKFVEIGGEDDDFTFRLAEQGISLPSVYCNHVRNASEPLARNSFGFDMTGTSRYSDKNAQVLREKWTMLDQPAPGSVYVPRHRKYVRRNSLTFD